MATIPSPASITDLPTPHAFAEAARDDSPIRRLLARVAVSRWLLALEVRRAAKRCLDVVGALAGLALLSPLLALTALAIRLESPGPVLFHQTRVGKRGRPFTMFKFRSMTANAEAEKASLARANESADGVLFKMKADPRITRVGRVIRRLSIDELPQLFNIVRGDMSIVGPRPALPDEVAQYDAQARKRLETRPGLTCIWQISGRSNLAFSEQVDLDLHYLRAKSLGNDIQIIARTVPAVISGKGAY